MADRDYIIEVVLKARDDMAAAFAAATGEMDAFDKKLDEQKAKTEAARLAQKDYARDLESGTSSVKRYNEALRDLGLQAKITGKNQDDSNKINNRAVSAHLALEAATKRLVTVQNSGTASSAEYARATQSVRNAELELSRALTSATQVSDKSTASERARSQARAKSVRTELEYQQRLDLTAQSLQKQADAEGKLAAAAARAEAQRSAAIDRTVASTQRYADVLARSTSSQTDEIRATRELGAARDRLTQLGLTTEQSEERIHAVRQQALKDYGYESQAIRDFTVRSNAQVDAYKLVEKSIRDVDTAERALDRSRKTRSGGLAPRAVSSETAALATVRPAGLDLGADTSKDVGSLGDALAGLQQHFQDLDTSTSGFLTHFKSAFAFGAVALIQPIAALLVGLVGTFGALASAAVAAGAAIGAGFVSAIAEGIPALGLFAAAMQRLQGVMGYVQGLMQQQQQSFIAQYMAAAQTKLGINQVAIAQHNYSDALYSALQAAQNVTIAQHSYSDALYSQRTAVHNVSVAELGLDEARVQATRQLQDLIFQETNARLAAEASTLAITDSQKALQQAIATGGDVQAAQLGVAQAQASHTQAVAQAQRAISDARPGSVARKEISETVDAAQRGVTEARRAVVDADFALRQAANGIVSAKRAVVDAEFQVAQAKAAITLAQQAAVGYNIATAAQLAYLRSQMSATEFALTKSIMRILDLFRGAHAYTRPLTDAILGPFVTLTNQIYKLLKDPQIFAALKSMSTAIGTGLGSIIKVIFDPKSISAFVTIIRDGAKNIAPLASIAGSMFKVLQEVVVTTGPLIRTFLGDLAGFASQFSQWAASTKGQNWLKQFFTDGFQALQAFMGLGLALIKLFLTIAGPGGGAQAGIKLIEGFTRALNNLTNDLNNKHSKAFKDLQKIWASAAPTLHVIGEVIGAIAGAFFQLGTSKQGQDSLKNIGDLIVHVLVPAFVKFATWLGAISGALLAFLAKHPALKSLLVDLIATFAVLTIGGKAFGLIFGPLASAFEIVGKLGKAFKYIKDLEMAKVFGDIASKAKGFGSGLGGILKGRIPGRGGAGAAKGAEGAAGDIIDFTGVGAGAAEAAPEVAEAGATAAGGAAAFAGAATGIGLIVAAIIALAKWTGTLKDLWNAIKAPFIAIWQAIQQPIQGFVKQFSYMVSGFESLFNEIAKGAGVFGIFRTAVGDILRPAFKIIGDVLGGVGKIIGNGLATAIKVISGFFEIIGGILHGNISKVEDGAKKIGLALLNGILNVVKIIGSTLLNELKDAFKGILTLGGFLLNLGESIGGKIAEGIVGALKGIGQSILGLITGAVNEGIIAPINWVIDRINGLPHIHLPFGLGTIAIPHIDHIGKLGGGGGGGQTVSNAGHGFAAQEGGPVPGGYGGGDIISAHLEPGEHVLTKEEVRSAGGHGAIFAIRAALGGGRQGGPGGYQAGGAAIPTTTPSTAVTSLGTQPSSQQSVLGVTGQLGATLANVLLFIKRFEDNWKNLWTNIANSTQDGINNEEDYFQGFFKNITKSLNSFQNNATDSIQQFWKQTNSYVQDQLTTLFTNFRWTYDHLSTDTFNAFWYINKVANQELKTFGAKLVQVQLAGQPTFATGGFVGQVGERGRDAVHALLGRGEAVLNYAHQSVVEPAMNAYYGFGLNKMFQRTSALHAGGGRVGMAAGGFAPTGRVILDSGVNMSVNQEPQILQDLRRLANELKETVYIISGYRSPSHSVAVGGFADDPHTRGEAADIGIGSASRSSMFSIAEAALKAVGLYRPFYPASAAEVNHVQLLSGGPTGGGVVPGVTSVVAGAKTTAQAWRTITESAVKGSGVLQTVLQSAIGRILGAANTYGQSQAGALAGTGGDVSVPGNIGGPVSQQISHALRALGWNKVAIAGAIGNAVQESSLSPGISGGGAAGLWQWTPGSKLFDFASGHKQPWQSVAVQAALMTQTIGRGGVAAMNAARSPADAATWLMNNFERPLASAANLPHRIAAATAAFAAGLAGGGFAGGARPILAHAGEWVVNQGQQSRIANWLGMSVGNLRGSLGFTGGPDSFQGGGEVSPLPGRGSQTFPSILPLDLGTFGFDAAAISRYLQIQGNVIEKIRGNGKKAADALKQFITNFGNVGGDGGIFALAAQVLQNYVSQQQTLVSLAASGYTLISKKIKDGSRTITEITQALRSTEPLTAVTLAQQDLDSTNRIIQRTSRLQREQVDALNQVNRRITQVQRGGVTQAEAKTYGLLLGARNQFISDIQTSDSALAQAYSDRYTKQATLFQAQVAQALRGTTTITGGQIGAATLGVGTLSPGLLQSSFNNLIGVTSRVGPTIATGIAQMAQTVAQALGDPSKLAISDQAVVDAAQAQHAALQTAYTNAAKKAQKDPRWQSVADDLLSQLESSVTTVVQAQTQALTDAIQAQQTAASRQMAALAIRDRLAAVQTALGDPFGAITAQIGTSQARAGALTQQIGQSRGLLAQATAQGNTTAINQLTDQISDLNAQVKESNLLTQQLVTSERQLAVTMLTTQTQASSGFFSAANSIAQTLGAIAGNQNLPTLIKYAKEAGASLIQQGSEAVATIQKALSRDPTSGLFAFGSNQGGAAAFLNQLTAAFQQGPQIFANTLAQLSPQLATFEAGLPPDQQTLFQNLVQSLIDNTTAQVTNTQQLQQLNATTNQQAFSSTAWQMFRQAIFNGLGGLLPTYAMTVPSLQMGGTLTGAGLVYGHVGESLIPANVSHGASGMGGTQNTNHFNITNPTEVADPVILGNAIAWRLSHDPNSR